MTKNSMPIRIVYFGTPAYSVPALRALTTDERFEVVLVVTQPDRPAGRGHALNQPAVKLAAIELGLPVYQPSSLRTPVDREPLVEASADLFVVAAYGLIFGARTLAIPKHGCLNLHASLLPRYRGASPVTAAILAGDAETGVTIMQMDVGMDTGGIVAMRSIAIRPDDTSATLTERLAQVGAELAVTMIPEWVEGAITARPQPAAGASLVRPLVKSDGWTDWSRTAHVIERQVRAMQPWPRAFTTSPAGQTIQILRVRVAPTTESEVGTVRVIDRQVVVACGEGSLVLERIQPAGSGEMDGSALIQGRKLVDGQILGVVNVPELPGPLITSVS